MWPIRCAKAFQLTWNSCAMRPCCYVLLVLLVALGNSRLPWSALLRSRLP